MVTWMDQVLPVFRLNRLFGLETPASAADGGLLVVIEENDHRYALLVDELIHRQEVVVKSLGHGIGRVLGVSGAAILGDGSVGLILEVAELETLARRLRADGTAAGAPRPEHSLCPQEADS